MTNEELIIVYPSILEEPKEEVEEQKAEEETEFKVGDIAFRGKESLNQMQERAKAILNDPTFREYLNLRALESSASTPSYIG